MKTDVCVGGGWDSYKTKTTMELMSWWSPNKFEGLLLLPPNYDSRKRTKDLCVCFESNKASTVLSWHIYWEE